MPIPKKVSSRANMNAMLSGNSLAIILAKIIEDVFFCPNNRDDDDDNSTYLKLPVRKPAFPQASMILSVNERPRNIFPFSILSRRPNRIEVTPTVPIPMFRVFWKKKEGMDGLQREIL